MEVEIILNKRSREHNITNGKISTEVEFYLFHFWCLIQKGNEVESIIIVMCWMEDDFFCRTRYSAVCLHFVLVLIVVFEFLSDQIM
jgi:hypothetical protein